MRNVFSVILAVLLTLTLAAPASAEPDSPEPTSLVSDPGLLAFIGDDDLFSVADLSTLLVPTPLGLGGAGTPTQHYGPFPSTSPDSGTCSDAWAEDTFDRHFTIRTSMTGEVAVVQQFKRGSFVTTAGTSPGACDTNIGGTITADKTGSMHGYFLISGAFGPQTSDSPFCNAALMTNANCTTATFINTHFAPCYPTTCTVTTYFFRYAAGDQDLALHSWKNASCDRGGNEGDVANNEGIRQDSPLCP
jgi:hypothetical protein